MRSGARLVFTDSARRRILATHSLRTNQSPTIGPSDPVPATGARFLLGEEADRRSTVALYRGLDYLRSPLYPDGRQFPEHRPFAALDGRLDTQWLAQTGNEDDRFLELGLGRPRPVDTIRVHPHSDSRGVTTSLAVSVNGGGEREVQVEPGWNAIRLDEPRLRTLRLRVDSVRRRPGIRVALGGIDELRVPGVRTSETLRLPTGLARATAGLDLSRTPISVLLERTTADFPYRAGGAVLAPQKHDPIDQVDAEEGLEREVSLPEGRAFAVDGWASAAPGAPDAALDALAGVPAGWRFSGSSRFEGVPGRRASSAFDGDARTAWAADFAAGRRTWLEVRAPRPFTVERLVLVPGPRDYLRPSVVRIDGARYRVGPGGAVDLGRALRTTALRVEVLRAHAGPRARRRNLRAVALAEVRVPGLAPPAPRREGRFASRCGELSVRAGGERAGIAVTGSLADLDAGHPLRMAGCGEAGGRIRLPAGATELSAPAGSAFRPDRLRLRSGAAPPAAAPGVVVDPGHGVDGRRDGVRLSLDGPAWLVLGRELLQRLARVVHRCRRPRARPRRARAG